MNRREVVLAGVGAAAAGVAVGGRALAEPAPASPASFGPLLDALYACIEVGQACQQHCRVLLGKGDTSLAECAGTIAAMLPVCAALTELSTLGSPRTKALALICAQVCRDCETACRKHAGHHAICKQCADSCAACAAQCDKVPA
jgi:Cys-rich four helix bundle protein (predicted Tat secretion target)